MIGPCPARQAQISSFPDSPAAAKLSSGYLDLTAIHVPEPLLDIPDIENGVLWRLRWDIPVHCFSACSTK